MRHAFIFDVFGTCVDWRTSVAREVARHVPGVDALAFATAWRGEYDPAMERIRTGGRGYVDLDVLHLENLERTATKFGVTLSDPKALNRAWERLDPWEDVVPGLEALRKDALIAPCSNGSIAMMARLARYARFPWDCILGAGVARDYKPKPEVYLASVAALRLEPKDVCMVAAHNSDLAAARALGLKTAFVPRPREHGEGQTTDLAPSEAWDWVAKDFDDLAVQVAR
ncbi:MAG: haloacid dehalogenase type II [Silicimonas sp.]|nr:haloacid dehalogenase type II [Silicimonas sp.]